MTLASLLRDYTAYNVWANRLMAEWLKGKPAELLDQEVVSSFPSLRQTIKHIMGAERIWASRLQGVSPSSFTPFDGTIPELLEEYVQGSVDFAGLIQSKDDSFFVQSIKHTMLNGTHRESLAAEIIQHCMQHSTFHRGQLVTMARSLGLTDPPQTDYIAYTRLRA